MTLPDFQSLELYQQQRLPHELLLDIFSYIEDKSDNLNLCKTSKVFRSLVESRIYKTIRLDFNDKKGKNMHSSLQLLEMIQNPRLWNVIKVVQVTSGSCHQRSKFASDQTKKCICGVIDQKLGTALQSMQTLEVLSIRCDFCLNLSTGRHRYLKKLATRRMRHFNFECRCSMGNGFDLPTLFTAPWVQSLNGLSWLTNLWITIPSEQLETLLKNPSFLPQLNTLHYTGSGMLDKLLTGRKITRLSGAVDPSTWKESHPNKNSITHLSVCTYIRILNSPGGIKQFRNLQHFGKLSFTYTERRSQIKMASFPLSAVTGQTYLIRRQLDIVNRIFDSIADLKCLSSIDGTTELIPVEDDPWNQVLFARLESTHPKLRKIFLNDQFRYGCIRKDGPQLWTKHQLPYYTSWDIITGIFDHI
ncbi:hypothetical protein M408DRAFT_28844 [Serendipita vermifera MAFF 305830]|uniref:F-box domain-containing protein n=1 Tax=Serendipita vermifera MAFF 305830 TaxID=933852 RepID=A0A0C2W770_SERVB|nr:hypothetical protein M408DRAFT_28844 [Serendipita vermifera MAFF 305830]